MPNPMVRSSGLLQVRMGRAPVLWYRCSHRRVAARRCGRIRGCRASPLGPRRIRWPIVPHAGCHGNSWHVGCQLGSGSGSCCGPARTRKRRSRLGEHPRRREAGCRPRRQGRRRPGGGSGSSPRPAVSRTWVPQWVGGQDRSASDRPGQTCCDVASSAPRADTKIVTHRAYLW